MRNTHRWFIFWVLGLILAPMPGFGQPAGTAATAPDNVPAVVTPQQQGQDPGLPPLPPPPGDPARQPAAPPLKMIAPGVFEIGEVRIYKNDQKVEFPCQVNMQKGLLEYAIVGGSGKTHESLLRTHVEPYALKIALLLLGLEGTVNPLDRQGDPRKPEGSPVSLWVQWKDGKEVKKNRIEEWIKLGQETATAMKPTQWIYTGSFVNNGVFMAQVERSIVAVYHDPVALIDNPSPQADSDKVWFVNEAKTPPPGTEVTVIVKREAEK